VKNANQSIAASHVYAMKGQRTDLVVDSFESVADSS